MAKGIYKEWLEPDNLALVRHWKMSGVTEAQIAKNIGIAVGTFERWKNEHSEFREALKRGKQHIEAFAVGKLFELIGEKNPAAIFFYLKCQCGWRENPQQHEAEKDQRDILEKLTEALNANAAKPKTD